MHSCRRAAFAKRRQENSVPPGSAQTTSSRFEPPHSSRLPDQCRCKQRRHVFNQASLVASCKRLLAHTREHSSSIYFACVQARREGERSSARREAGVNRSECLVSSSAIIRRPRSRASLLNVRCDLSFAESPRNRTRAILRISTSRGKSYALVELYKLLAITEESLAPRPGDSSSESYLGRARRRTGTRPIRTGGSRDSP